MYIAPLGHRAQLAQGVTLRPGHDGLPRTAALHERAAALHRVGQRGHEAGTHRHSAPS